MDFHVRLKEQSWREISFEAISEVTSDTFQFSSVQSSLFVSLIISVRITAPESHPLTTTLTTTTPC